MLREARAAAEAAGVDVEWVQADAVTYKPDRMFDAVICLCEGAFGLVGRDEEPAVRECKRLVEVKERRYFPSELVAMCATAGLTVRNVWGGTVGNRRRQDIDLDEVEIMVVATKQ